MRKDVPGSYDIAVDPFRERHSGRFTTRRRAGLARRDLDALEKPDTRELEMGMVGESGAAEKKRRGRGGAVESVRCKLVKQSLWVTEGSEF